MTKHKDYTIERSDWHNGFTAVHEGYDVSLETDGSLSHSHPIFTGGDVDECIEQIDEWYEESADAN